MIPSHWQTFRGCQSLLEFFVDPFDPSRGREGFVVRGREEERGGEGRDLKHVFCSKLKFTINISRRRHLQCMYIYFPGSRASSECSLLFNPFKTIVLNLYFSTKEKLVLTIIIFRKANFMEEMVLHTIHEIEF